jgi:pre-mRNA-processing factor 6
LALKKTNDHPMIILTIAQDLWKLGKMDRAQQFFKACLDKDANYGDAYVHYYAFLLKFGSREEIAALEKMFLEGIHLHGELWERTEATNWLSRSSYLTTLREAAVGVTKIM